MFGYPRLEGLDLYDLVASRIEPEVWTRRRGIAQRTLVDFSYVQKTITTANRTNGLVAAPGVMFVGNSLRVGFGFKSDLFALLSNSIGEVSLDPEFNESDFRSLYNGRLSAVHVLSDNWGVTGRLDIGDLLGIRGEYERASFEHGLISGTGADATLDQTTEVERGRTALGVELMLANLSPAAGSVLPDSLEVGIVNQDDLTPEGYTFLLRYDDPDLQTMLGGGYGVFRDVLFGSARLDILSLAASTSVRSEYRRGADTGVELTEARFGIDWISYLVWLIDDDIPLRGTGAAFLGMEYADTPSDIEERIDRSVPPPWSLVLRLGDSGQLLNGAFFIEGNLSGFARLFADADNVGWVMRFGIYAPSFRDLFG